MAVDRLVPTSATPGIVYGDDFMDAASEEFGGLWDRSRIRISGVGGTANAVVGTITPALTAGLVDGMRFTIVPIATNTGAVTFNGTSVVDKDGTALQAGDWVSGRLHEFEYHALSDKFRLLGGVTADGAYHYYNAFTASGTWTKPSGVSADALVIVWAWGAGGGGGTGTRGGGGGGGYGTGPRIFRLGDLSSTETVTIGAAGTTNGQGGNTTLGTKLTAYGGGGGNSTTAGGGGGGGGPSAKGANASSGNGGAAGGIMGGAGGATGANGGSTAGGDGVGGGGGGGGDTGGGSSGSGSKGGDAWFGGGGGGGGGQSSASAGNGGSSVWGGGGGAGLGSSGATAGTSIHGGNGGSSGNTGTAPGGGGGRNAAGARGELRILILA